MLCFVRLFDGVKLNSGGSPCGSRTWADQTPLNWGKLYVTDADNIDGPAGIIEAERVVNGRTFKRNYYVYPEMIPNDLRVGETKRLK